MKKKKKKKKARKWPSYSLAGVRFSNEICDERQVAAENNHACVSACSKSQLIVSDISHWWTGE